MVKKVTTVSIDENILRMAKKELPNISVFVEDCLKAYLGYNNTQIKTIDENLSIIQNALLNIQIASMKDKDTTIVEQYNYGEQNKAWNVLFGKWRNQENINIDDWETTSKILNVTVRELKDLMEVLEFENVDLIKCNDWNYVREHYLQ